MNENQICEAYGCEPLQLWRWIKLGIFPRPQKVGDVQQWDHASLKAWEADQGIEMIDAYKKDQAENDKRNKGAKWTSEPTTKVICKGEKYFYEN